MVETAFTLVLLVMLLIGITTAGIAYGQANALQTAAREGARFGATLPDAVNNLSDILNVTKAAAVGDLEGGVPGQYICVAYVNPDDGSTASLEEDGGTQSTGSSECFLDGRPSDEERIQVVVEREATINAVVFSTDITLDSSSAARYER